MSSIAILISFRNTKKAHNEAIPDLINCLNSLLKSVEKLELWQGNEVNPLIFVIDDHSEEEYDHLIPKHILDRITIIHNESAVGQGKALNFGLNNIVADFYAFTDSDCIVSYDWLYNIVNYFDKHPNCSCVVGPNWKHQNPTNRWQKYVTDNESKLMKHIFESYITNDSKSSLRIDCRNLAFKNSLLAKFENNQVFSTAIYSNSSQTSYYWRKLELDMGTIVGFSEQLLVYHKYIPSLWSHMRKYYKRGKYGDFKRIYSGHYGSLFSAFIKYYFKRHLINPIYSSNVSIFYLWSVHNAYWIGIIMNRNIED